MNVDNISKKKIITFIILGLILIILGFYFLNKNKIGEIKYSENTNSEQKKVKEEVRGQEEIIVYEKYAEIINSCDSSFVGECVNLRSKPNVKSKVFSPLRNGVILKVLEKVEIDGISWYKIYFDEWVRYPNRLGKTAYISAEYVKIIEVKKENNKKDKITIEVDSSKIKKIVIDISSQTLYAYEGEDIFMQQKVSTGLKGTPTPRGTFKIMSKTPSRYMQGPLPGISSQEYDLPGVPWTMYFTKEGGAIHGTYWHQKFGQKWSHGCVNLPTSEAEKLYNWTPMGTKVIVK